MPHFAPLEIFFSHLLLLCSTLYHPLLSLVRLKVAFTRALDRHFSSDKFSFGLS